MNARLRRGSSLVELLVVVAIIAMLMAALVPSLRRTMLMARNTVCMHNIHMIGQGLSQYRFENDGWLPTPGVSSAAQAQTPDVWFLKLYPTYLTDPVVLSCPEDPFKFRMQQTGQLQNVMQAPQVANYASYGINSFIITAGDGSLADLDRRWPSRPLDIILAADMGPDHIVPQDNGGGGNQGDYNAVNGPDRNLSMLTWDDGYDPFVPTQNINPWVTQRHGESINVLTIDGSVRNARTRNTLQSPIQRYYSDCAAGGCTLCNYLHFYHYSFAKDRLYWWTGFTAIE